MSASGNNEREQVATTNMNNFRAVLHAAGPRNPVRTFKRFPRAFDDVVGTMVDAKNYEC
jgi:hypothetical protein